MKMEYMTIGKLRIFTCTRYVKYMTEWEIWCLGENYINSGSVFNGFSKNGMRLSSGTYYYVLNLENSDDVFKGSLTIVR